MNPSSSFKYMALNWAQINIMIYIELFLGSTDFHFSLGTQDVPFCTCVHQQVLQKLSLIAITVPIQSFLRSMALCNS